MKAKINMIKILASFALDENGGDIVDTILGVCKAMGFEPEIGSQDEAHSGLNDLLTSLGVTEELEGGDMYDDDVQDWLRDL